METKAVIRSPDEIDWIEILVDGQHFAMIWGRPTIHYMPRGNGWYDLQVNTEHAASAMLNVDTIEYVDKNTKLSVTLSQLRR